MGLTTVERRFVEALPMAELHCHLEGAIRPATVIDLAEQHGIDLPFEDVAGAENYYDFDDLAGFLEVFDLACSTLRTPADFERVTVELAADAARQSIPYREVFFTYAYHDRRGVPWADVVEGIAAGRRRAREEYDVELRFIADIDRRIDPAAGVELVERADEARAAAGIVGIGLDSQEQGFPAHRHAPAFDRAAELDFARVAHAGEDVGPASVWDALLALDVDRIDHGVRAAEDPILVEYLDREAIPLTTCPVSNVALEVYDEMGDHPIGPLFDRGLHVTVNSDDPALFLADLEENFERVAATFDLTPTDIVTLARRSFEDSFLPQSETERYLDRVDAAETRLRSELDLPAQG
jgi:adenosine deaminase